MRITGHVAPLQNLLLAAMPKAGAFAVADQPVATSPPAAPLGQPVSVEMLVALANAESPIDRRRRSIAQASGALGALERLNTELLAGLAAPERLREIAAWAEATRHGPEDAALASLFRDIELRMRVELAKHDISA